MKATLRIPLLYAGGSALWLAGAEWGLGRAGMPLAGPLQSAGFVVLSTLLIYGLLRREGRRRDRLEQDLRRIASCDPLTGLVNRTCFVELLETAVTRAAETHRKVGVAFVDLDGFKRVNDAYGHDVGDRLLVAVARRIQAMVRAEDCCCRFGGDEFVVLVHGEREDGCRHLAERLVDDLHAPFFVDGRRFVLSASVGFALYPDHGVEAHLLLRAADLAMYKVKEQGKDAVMEALSSAA